MQHLDGRSGKIRSASSILVAGTRELAAKTFAQAYRVPLVVMTLEEEGALASDGKENSPPPGFSHRDSVPDRAPTKAKGRETADLSLPP